MKNDTDFSQNTCKSMYNYFSGNRPFKGTNYIDMIVDSPTCIMLFDKDTMPLACNASALHTFGFKDEDEFLRAFPELITDIITDVPHSAKDTPELMKELILSGNLSFDLKARTGNGASLTLNATFSDLFIVEQTHDIFIGYFRDISHFVQEQEQERLFRARMQAILDATPLCLNLWNKQLENVLTNAESVTLFDLSSTEEYLEHFFSLSPEYQPNGKRSSELVPIYMGEAFEKGYKRFNWLHCKLNGEEIPTEITLKRLDNFAGDNIHMVVGFTRDLRSSMAGSDVDSDFYDYFHNIISDKALFNTVTDLSDDLIFHYDSRSSLMQYYGSGCAIFGIGSERHVFPDHLISNGIVHPDDHHILTEMSFNLRKGVNRTVDLRLIPVGGTPRYHRLSYKFVENKDGDYIYAVGKAVDIDEQKNLEFISKTDLLTNCYNKVSAESAIADALYENRKSQHAIFIIDIDNFKGINDNLGHHFGDLVLSEVAAELLSCVRSQDIVGRIGGDEFIVFMRDTYSDEIIERKAQSIAKTFQRSYGSDNIEHKIAGSIGISRYPQDGNTFEDLYKAADKALYQSKLRGKNCHTFYSDELLVGTMRNRTILENSSRIANSFFDSEIISVAFNLLYETNDVASSINAVLRYIGKQINADRCYIFETFDEGKTYDNTYEWCKEGIGAEIDNLQGLTVELLANFIEDANEDGILYSNDLSVLTADGAYDLMADQGIKSFLHAQVREKGYVTVFLGVDDCTRHRVWNEKSINTMVYVAKIVSTFLKFHNILTETNGNSTSLAENI